MDKPLSSYFKVQRYHLFLRLPSETSYLHIAVNDTNDTQLFVCGTGRQIRGYISREAIIYSCGSPNLEKYVVLNVLTQNNYSLAFKFVLDGSRAGYIN